MRLEATRKSGLAVHALRLLADDGGRLKGSELAPDLGTTPGFVSQVLAELVKAGWIDSDPGPHGGYALTADLCEVSVLAVIEAMEGPTDTGRCVLAGRPCDADEECSLHTPWTRARDLLLDELRRTPVAEAPLGQRL